MKKCLSIIISAVMIMSMMSVPLTVSADTDADSGIVTLLKHTFDNDGDTLEKLGWVEGVATSKILNVTKEISTIASSEGVETNKAMKLSINDTANSDANIKWYKAIDSAISQGKGGVYKLSFDTYVTSLTKNQGFSIGINKNSEGGTGTTGQILLNNKFGSKVSFSVTGPETSKNDNTGTWDSYEIVYNSITHTIALYLNGTQVIPFASFTDTNPLKVDTIGSVTFILNRGNAVNDSVYFDNILLTQQSATEYDKANTLPEELTYIEGENLTLPTKGLTGSTITWTSDNESVINPATGAVTPSTDGETTVTLTATVSDGTSTAATKSYEVTVPKGVSNEAYAQEDANAIVAPDYVGQEMIDLPIAGTENGSTIAWSSNNSAVMNVVNGNKWDRAYVTVPAETTTVKLTAAVTYNGATVNKDFVYAIYGKDTPLEEDFALNAYSGDINGYNGWTVSKGTNAKYDDVTTGAVTNGALVVTQGATTNSNGRLSWEIAKKFRQVTGGIAEISLTATLGQGDWKAKAGFDVECGNAQFTFCKAQLRCPADESGTRAFVSYNETDDHVYDIRIRLNNYSMTADVIVNGVAVKTNIPLATGNGIVDSVILRPLRQQHSATYDAEQFTIIFDNVNVKRIVPEIQIADIHFTDAYGNAAIDKTDGSLVSGVTVYTNEDSTESVTVVATVSDSTGKISSVAMGSAANLTKDKSVYVAFAKPAQLPVENAEEAVVSLYAMDSLNNLIPLTCGKLNHNGGNDGKVQFFMCGDSIMCNYGSSTNTVGVGMRIANFFDADKVSVTNLAKSGSSTKTFYEEKYELQNNLGSIKNGDYVFLMFGHNDSSAAAKGTDEAYYKLYLTKMINMVRTKGAIPVLMSPVVRYTPYTEDDATTDIDETKLLNNESLKKYRNYMEELATELNVKFIDVNSMTLNLIQNEYGVGSNAADELYILGLNNGSAHDEIEAGSLDTTHLTDTGATKVAELISDYMKTNNWLPAGYFAE